MRGMETSWRARGAAVLAAAALGLACEKATPRAPKAADATPRSVRTAAVERLTEGAETAVPAVVQARQRATLASRIPASVVALPYLEGERVAAGAVVVRLDDAALRAAVTAAEAGDSAAAADLARVEGLLGKGAATPRERDEAASRAAGARAAVFGARDNLSYAVLRAPFAGRVAVRPAHVGDVVSPGATLVEIEGEGGMEIVGSVEGFLAATIRSGAAVRADVDGQPGLLAARIRSVAPAGDPATHRFEVKADLPAADGLRAGLFARLLLPTPGAEPRLLVPSSSLVRRGGLAGVFVVADGTARLRWIAEGASADGRTEVRAGVEAGERVATDPAGLEDGTAVRESR